MPNIHDESQHEHFGLDARLSSRFQPWLAAESFNANQESRIRRPAPAPGLTLLGARV
jgi:hypothetical protein